MIYDRENKRVTDYMHKHLTTEEIGKFARQELDEQQRAQVAAHLADCAICRLASQHARKVDASELLAPREQTSGELPARSSAMTDWQASQEQARRVRLPLIGMATLFSLLLFAWFMLEMLVAFQESGVLDFFALFSSHPELLSTYSWDAIFALLEALPAPEMVLTLFSLITAAVLAQQLLETIRSHPLPDK
jgi:anti-sigma factor RsiW